MTDTFQKKYFYLLSGPGRANSFGLLLLFISTAVFAAANGITHLPESYRTPLSDMVYDDHKEWRVEPDDKNPWREGEEELILQPRLKAEFFPQYNYDSVQNPNPGSLFQNENEIDKPVSNIFKYTF